MKGLRSLLLDLSVRRKLLAGFGLVLFITLVIAWISYQALDSVFERFAKLNHVAEIKALVADARQGEKNFLLRMKKCKQQQKSLNQATKKCKRPMKN